MLPCPSATFDCEGAPANDASAKSGHSFTDRLASQKSRAIARRKLSAAPAVRTPSVSEIPTKEVQSLGRKHFSPVNRSNQEFTSDAVAGGPNRSPKMADRFTAQKSRALARREQIQVSDIGAVCGLQGTDEEAQQKPGRKQFRPGLRGNENIKTDGANRSDHLPQGQGLSDHDSLAQLMRDEALEARRRLVPGLCPPSAESNTGPRPRLVSTQPPPAHRGSQPWGGSNQDHEPERRHSITHGMPSEGRGGSNMFAKGNAGNMITDRPTSRVLKPPGGGSSFVVGKW